MNKQDMLKVQTCILKVNIRCVCDGCEQKVKKLLQKMDGVYSVSVDAEQGKVIVTGNNVDPAKLIKKLKRSGKHAELWGGSGQKGMNMMINNQNFPAKQLKNLQIENNSKGGKDNKSQKVGGGQPAYFQNKGAKNQKFDASDGSFDEYEDDDEFHDDYYDDEEFDHHNKMMPVMGNGGAMNKKSKGNNGGNVNTNAKKGDDLPIQMKGKGGNSEVKNGKGGKQKAGDEKKESKSGGGGGLIGRFLGLGEKSKKGGGGAHTDKNMKNGVGGGGGNNKGKEGKMGGGGKLEGHADKNSRMDEGFDDFYISAQGKGGKGGKSKNVNDWDGRMGQMGLMSEGGAMGQMGNVPVGDYQRIQYNPQQQYMAMMMNHEQAANMNKNLLYPQSEAMYGRPHPSMGYMPPPPMPSHPMSDPITHVFSDENTESCIIM